MRGEGTPMSWLAEPGGAVPTIQLVPASARQARQAAALSAQWLIVLLIVWAVTLWGTLRTALRWLWPELMVLLGLVGWQVVGPALIVLFLLALGLAGRVLLIGRGVSQRVASRGR